MAFKRCLPSKQKGVKHNKERPDQSPEWPDVGSTVYCPSHKTVKITTSMFKEKAQERKMRNNSVVELSSQMQGPEFGPRTTENKIQTPRREGR